MRVICCSLTSISSASSPAPEVRSCAGTPDTATTCTDTCAPTTSAKRSLMSRPMALRLGSVNFFSITVLKAFSRKEKPPSSASTPPGPLTRICSLVVGFSLKPYRMRPSSRKGKKRRLPETETPCTVIVVLTATVAVSTRALMAIASCELTNLTDRSQCVSAPSESLKACQLERYGAAEPSVSDSTVTSMFGGALSRIFFAIFSPIFLVIFRSRKLGHIAMRILLMVSGVSTLVAGL
mmetsp:Transcript_29668/g.76151  ORF Transcript_29668/g.76151 Transcript_29668/m.76151 type:complete len:237 (+) Transcript_29668:1321-2031(+)